MCSITGGTQTMYLKPLDYCLKNKIIQIETENLKKYDEKGAVLHLFGKEKIVDTLYQNLQKEMEVSTCEEVSHRCRKEMWIPLDGPLEKIKHVAEYVNTFNSDRKNKLLCEVYSV